jgi:hypothetical protein
MPGDFSLTGLDTMNRSRLFLVASLPLAVAVIVGVLSMLPPRSGVTKANFDRIENGMTLEEVETILGGPAHWQGKIERWHFYKWRCDDGATANVTMYVTREVVCAGRWIDSTETIREKIRRWLCLN